MPDLNTKKITSGTPNKVIRLAFESLKENPTFERSVEYFETYSQFDVPVILENSRYIFSEPNYGYDYYKTVMESGCVPFVEYLNERDKIKRYMMEYATVMNTKTTERFQSLYEFVDELWEKHKNCAIAEASLGENRESVDRFLSEAFQCLQGEEHQEALLEAYQALSPLAQVLYVSENASALDLEYELISTISDMHTDVMESTDMDDFSNTMHLTMLLNRMGQDKVIQESFQKFDNKHLKMIYGGLTVESVVDTLEEVIIKNVDETPRVHTTVFEAVNDMLELQIDDDGFYAESAHMGEYENTLRKYIVYENALDDLMAESVYVAPEEVGNYSEVVREYVSTQGYDPSLLYIENVMHLMVDAVAELEEACHMLENAEYLKEYREDGKQTGTIRRHASTLMEKDNPKAEKNSKPDNWKENIKDQVPDKDWIEGSDDGDSEDKKDDSKKEEKQERPKMPKQSLHSKIQKKALDADVKAKSAGAKIKKLATDVKQTGKAILRVPGNLVNSVKGFIKSWDSWTDEQKKEQILKPGFRKGFWAKFRAVCVYGLSFAISPFMVVITYMVRRCSAEKSKYLRNELALELQTEIKVVDAKIEDAQSQGNSKAKYQLMRIRDKLEKERVRVVSNSKYV